MKGYVLIFVSVLLFASPTWADEVSVKMSLTTASGPGKAIGTIVVKDTPYGALFTPDLKNLTAGAYGFHVHENANCGPKQKDGKMVPALAAGGHYDPDGTGRHEGPYGDGHLGDLPPLFVDDDGTSTLPVLAPRLKVADMIGRSLMIHAGGDNYSDQPEKLGGGGARMACGIAR